MHRTPNVLVRLALGCALALGPAAAEAADIFVDTSVDEQDFSCTNGDCSLRDAIFIATAGDRIVIPAATYTLDLGTSILLDRDLVLEGAGAATTVIEAASAPGVATDRIFLITDPAITLRDLTIRHGAGQDVGGAILSGGVLDIERCVLTANRANNLGGAIFSTGSLVISDSEISGNVAGGNDTPNGGGGIYAGGDQLTLIDSTVSANQALRGSDPTDPGSGDGGGVYINAVPATITSTPITGNHADDRGGGLFVNGSTLGLSLESIRDNTAGDNGGGIFTFSSSVVTIGDSTIAGNAAGGSGGGIANEGGQVDLTNATVSTNTANLDGGGIFNVDVLRLANVTVTANVADADMNDTGVAGGIHGSPFGGDTIELANSVLAGNTNPCPTCTPSPDCRTPVDAFTSLGYNIVGDRTQCSGFIDGVGGDQVGNAAAPIHPLLSPLMDNGGSTHTHQPAGGSPVIDRGNPSGCLDLAGLPLADDQRGAPRPVDGDGSGGPTCDIGSFELGGTPLDPIFSDGFETGDTSRWSSAVSNP